VAFAVVAEGFSPAARMGKIYFYEPKADRVGCAAGLRLISHYHFILDSRGVYLF